MRSHQYIQILSNATEKDRERIEGKGKRKKKKENKRKVTSKVREIKERKGKREKQKKEEMRKEKWDTVVFLDIPLEEFRREACSHILNGMIAEALKMHVCLFLLAF